MATAANPVRLLREAFALTRPIFNPLLLIFLPEFIVNLLFNLWMLAIVPVSRFQFPLLAWWDIHAWFGSSAVALNLLQKIAIGFGSLGIYILLVKPVVEACALLFLHTHQQGQTFVLTDVWNKIRRTYPDLVGTALLSLSVALPVYVGLALVSLGLAMLQIPFLFFLLLPLGWLAQTYLDLHLLFIRYPLLLEGDSALLSFIRGWEFTDQHFWRLLSAYLVATTGVSVLALIPGMVANPPAWTAPILQAPPLDIRWLRAIQSILGSYIHLMSLPAITAYYLLVYRRLQDLN
jgi:hypothetical protein